MNRSHSISLIFLLMFLYGTVFGQQPEMADGFRSEGKIYVLVAIILVILAGLLYFVLRLDGKVSRLEREAEKKN